MRKRRLIRVLKQLVPTSNGIIALRGAARSAAAERVAGLIYYPLSPYRKIKISLRITLATAALGTLLVSPGHAGRFLMRKATFVRRPSRGRTRPPATRGTLSRSGLNTSANAAIHRLASDVASRRQHLWLALAPVDAQFPPRIVSGRSVQRKACRTSSR
jgi:hypothetical protein